jgi:hypothetical protein
MSKNETNTTTTTTAPTLGSNVKLHLETLEFDLKSAKQALETSLYFLCNGVNKAQRDLDKPSGWRSQETFAERAHQVDRETARVSEIEKQIKVIKYILDSEAARA